MTDDLARSTVARGNNFVLYAPPSASAATSTLQGIIESGRGFLGLVPLDAIGEWARVAGHLQGSSSMIAATTSPDRLARLLPVTKSLTLTTPDTALEAVHRAGLKLSELAGVLIVWPERWAEGGDQLAALLQEVPKEAQRVMVSSDPLAAAPLVERYAWRAAIGDELGPVGEPVPSTVQATPVSWARRTDAIADLVEQLDPPSLTVWTASVLDHETIRARLATSAIEAAVVTDTAPAAPVIIAYDLPSPGQLREMVGMGDIVLLVPPGTEQYVARLVSNRKPLHLSTALDRARTAAEKDRREILSVLEGAVAPADLELLAPIFERHEATVVAAALLKLWRQARTTGTSEPPVRREEAAARIWVSAGKKDGATPNDFVAVLVRQCEVPRAAIGRIEIRDAFSLLEIAKSADPDQVAERLTGKTIKRRRLVARLDRPSASLVQRVSKRLPRPKNRGSA